MSWYIDKGVPPFTQEGYEVTNKKGESYWFQTLEWAELCREHFRRLDRAVVGDITYTNVVIRNTTNSIHTTNSIQYHLYAPEPSEWKCYMFGSNGDGVTWIPRKGKEPNWFWRKMQWLAFGNRWLKQ